MLISFLISRGFLFLDVQYPENYFLYFIRFLNFFQTGELILSFLLIYALQWQFHCLLIKLNSDSLSVAYWFDTTQAAQHFFLLPGVNL